MKRRLKSLLVPALFLLTCCAGAQLPPQLEAVPQLPVEAVLNWWNGTGGRCSAVVIEDGLALTAQHCVDEGISASAHGINYTGQRWEVQNFRASEHSDIAVLNLKGEDSTPHAAIAPTFPPMGSVVFIVGFGCPSPDPAIPLVRGGVWTGYLDEDGDHVTFGEVCPGDSGGALFNADGELLGIISQRNTGRVFTVPIGAAADLFDGPNN